MGDVDEGDAELIFQTDQLVLHVLAQFQIESAERLIEEQKTRLIHDRARDRDSLLLTTTQGVNGALLVAVEVYELERILDFVVDVCFGLALDLQTKGDVLCNVHVGEQRIFLEYGV